MDVRIKSVLICVVNHLYMYSNSC